MSTKIGAAMDHVKDYLHAMSENSISGKVYSLPEEYIFNRMEAKITNLWNCKSEFVYFKEKNECKENSLLNRAKSLVGAVSLSVIWGIARVAFLAFTLTGIILGSMENGICCLSKKHRDAFKSSLKLRDLEATDYFERRDGVSTIDVLPKAAGSDSKKELPNVNHEILNEELANEEGELTEDPATVTLLDQI